MRPYQIAFAIGFVLTAIAIIKFSIVGYYPDEVLPFGIILALGAAALFTGTRLKDRQS